MTYTSKLICNEDRFGEMSKLTLFPLCPPSKETSWSTPSCSFFTVFGSCMWVSLFNSDYIFPGGQYIWHHHLWLCITMCCHVVELMKTIWHVVELMKTIFTNSPLITRCLQMCLWHSPTPEVVQVWSHLTKMHDLICSSLSTFQSLFSSRDFFMQFFLPDAILELLYYNSYIFEQKYDN